MDKDFKPGDIWNDVSKRDVTVNTYEAQVLTKLHELNTESNRVQYEMLEVLKTMHQLAITVAADIEEICGNARISSDRLACEISQTELNDVGV